MDSSTLARWVKKFRILTLTLVFSGALNIGLIAAFVFSSLKQSQGSFPIALAASSQALRETRGSGSVAGVLDQMAKLSFHELVSYLTNKDWIEEGLSKRDLALASLTACHHFNLEKALSSTALQRRSLSLPEGKSIEVYPGLTEEQFEAVLRFAYEEKWPLTAKGLFLFLKKFPEARDPSLIQAFSVTAEFHFLQTLFQKTGAPQDPGLLVQLILEGDWELIAQFAKEQSQILDLTIEKRRSLLSQYLANHSPVAAELWLATDAAFALKKFEDQELIEWIHLLNHKTAASEQLCLDLLRSPRSDAVLQSAVLRLFTYSGEPLPSPFDLKAAIARFLPEASSSKPLSVAKQAVSKEPSYAQHVVKDGENLWKIARTYKVKVEELVKSNDLEKDRLYPGMVLRIPQKQAPQGSGSEPPR